LNSEIKTQSTLGVAGGNTLKETYREEGNAMRGGKEEKTVHQRTSSPVDCMVRQKGRT